MTNPHAPSDAHPSNVRPITADESPSEFVPRITLTHGSDAFLLMCALTEYHSACMDRLMEGIKAGDNDKRDQWARVGKWARTMLDALAPQVHI